jgi:hypothetical protein
MLIMTPVHNSVITLHIFASAAMLEQDNRIEHNIKGQNKKARTKVKCHQHRIRKLLRCGAAIVPSTLNLSQTN